VLVRRPEEGPASETFSAPRSEVRVQEVVAPDDATLRGFVELMHFGFAPEARTVPDQALRDGMRAGRNEGADLFVATLHGTQIGAAQAVTRDGITILFGASVLKPYRRRGAQQALLRARMERGHSRGCEWAAVFCLRDSGTYRNAERLGFVRSYTRLQWRQPER
jgi:GNAT superfamily N-acetyltransferase